MVIFDLQCEFGHVFEGWFSNSDDLQQQLQDGSLSCPSCGSVQVTKQFAAPKVTRKTNSKTQAPQLHTDNSQSQMVNTTGVEPEKYAHVQKMLSKVHDFVEQNFEDVGNKFSEKAIGMARGEIDEANIRGTASQEQVKEMAQEGVKAAFLPPKPVDPKKLN